MMPTHAVATADGRHRATYLTILRIHLTIIRRLSDETALSFDRPGHNRLNYHCPAADSDRIDVDTGSGKS